MSIDWTKPTDLFKDILAPKAIRDLPKLPGFGDNSRTSDHPVTGRRRLSTRKRLKEEAENLVVSNFICKYPP